MSTAQKPKKKHCPFAGLPRHVGHVYIFCRESHDWHGCEVAVLEIKGRRYKVAKSADVCEGLLAPKNSKKRKLQTWSCKHEELW